MNLEDLLGTQPSTVDGRRWRTCALVPTDAPGPALAACLRAATAAPSIYNTQPWLFRIHRDGVNVVPDLKRRLTVADPSARELLISVGGAVLNLRLAILLSGRVPIVRQPAGPVREDSTIQLAIGPRTSVSTSARRLGAAIGRRRTNRHPFGAAAVPQPVLRELWAAAAAEGATLAVPEPNRRDAVLEIIRTADRRRSADPAYRAELARWTGPAEERRDGVTFDTVGSTATHNTVPLRDFLPGRVRHRPRPVPFEDRPRIVVLSTAGDGPADWLRAGQALERLWLTATVRGLSVTPMTQALELPDLRGLLADINAGCPQLVLRLGYGPLSASSPRRALADVLLD